MVRSELFSGFHGYLPIFPLQNRKKPGAVLQAFSLSWVLSSENIPHGLRQPVRLLRRVEGGKADPDRAGVQRPGGAVGQRRAMQPRPHRDPSPCQRFAHGLCVPPRHPEGHHSRLGQTAGMGERLYPGQSAQTLRRPAGQSVFMAACVPCRRTKRTPASRPAIPGILWVPASMRSGRKSGIS